MKRIILIIGIITSLFPMPLNAGKVMNRADVNKKSNQSIGNSRQRSPMHLPTIDIIYDTDDLTIEFLCSTDCEANVYVYNDSGELIDSADTLSATLYLPPAPATTYHIIIESDNWYANADITL